MKRIIFWFIGIIFWFIVLAIIGLICGGIFAADKYSGYSERVSAIGRVIEIVDEAPIFCPNYSYATISIFQGGINYSPKNIKVWIDGEDKYTIKKSFESGENYRFLYRVKRFSMCYPNLEIIL